MQKLLLLLAHNARFDEEMLGIKKAATVAVIGFLIAIAGLLFSMSKDSERKTSPAVKWIAFGISVAIGSGIIAYAWLAI
jgi:hypothetical protein